VGVVGRHRSGAGGRRSLSFEVVVFHSPDSAVDAVGVR